MCGLFGSIGRNPSEGVLRTLAVLNEKRGTHAFGLFASDANYIKWSEKATACLIDLDFTEWLRKRVKDEWFIAGHTRWATTGSKHTAANAHPFTYGSTIGSHNGVVDAPKEYDVDSMYIFDLLEQNKQDYQEALQSVSGYFTLTWTDGKHFYILSHDNEVYVTKGFDGVYYYSSLVEHLETALGPINNDDLYVVKDGMCLRFAEGEDFEVLEDFVSIAEPRFKVSAAGRAKGVRAGSSWNSGGYIPYKPANTTTPAERYYTGDDEFTFGGLDVMYPTATPEELERLLELEEDMDDSLEPENEALWEEYTALYKKLDQELDHGDMFDLDKPFGQMTDREFMAYEAATNNHFDTLTTTAADFEV